MGKIKIFWIIVGALFLVFIVEDWALYRPGANKLRRLNEAIAESRDEALGSRFPAETLEKIKGLIEQNSLRGEVDSGGENPASEPLGRLMEVLKELEIELLAITPQEVFQESFSITSSFVIELRCGYHQLRELLGAIEKSDDLIGIREFDLEVVQDEVVASLFLEIYQFTGGAEE